MALQLTVLVAALSLLNGESAAVTVLFSCDFEDRRMCGIAGTGDEHTFERQSRQSLYANAVPRRVNETGQSWFASDTLIMLSSSLFSLPD